MNNRHGGVQLRLHCRAKENLESGLRGNDEKEQIDFAMVASETLSQYLRDFQLSLYKRALHRNFSALLSLGKGL